MTFGKTDMAIFYPEERAPTIMRIVGGAFLVFGLIFLFALGFPFKGPGQFKAVGEAKDYLSRTYGSSGGSYHLEAKSESSDNTVVVIDYRYGQHAGSLRASWSGDHYSVVDDQQK